MKKIKEDLTSVVPANAAGSGKIEGIGVGPKGEPGVYQKKKKLSSIITTKPLTRKAPV
jgi:hypothetical protein